MFDFLFGKKEKSKKSEEEKGKGNSKKEKNGQHKKEDKEKGDKGTSNSESEKMRAEDFEHLCPLGKGSFGNVMLCRCKRNNQFYAVKIVTKRGVLEHHRVQDVFTERNILSRSSHPFVMKLYWTFQDKEYVYFVMKYMPGGSLDNYVKRRPNKRLDLFTAKIYLMEVLLAILFLHENKVLYRDLKPENVLLGEDGHCTIIDFGLSKDFFDNAASMLQANSFVGSPYYVAPEILKCEPYSTPVDFWSFGILAFYLLVGTPPFMGGTHKNVFDAITNKKPFFPSTVPISSEAKDLILNLLVKDPERRLHGEKVKEHPFWEGISWEDVYEKKIKLPNWIPPKPVTIESLGQAGGLGVQGSGGPPPQGRGAANAPGVGPDGLPSGAPTATDQQLFQDFSYSTDNAV